MLPTALLSLLREYRSEQFREWYKPREVDTRLPIRNERSTSRTKLYGRRYSPSKKPSGRKSSRKFAVYDITGEEKLLWMRAFFSRRARIFVEVLLPFLFRPRRSIVVMTRVIVQKIAFSRCTRDHNTVRDRKKRSGENLDEKWSGI